MNPRVLFLVKKKPVVRAWILGPLFFFLLYYFFFFFLSFKTAPVSHVRRFPFAVFIYF